MFNLYYFRPRCVIQDFYIKFKNNNKCFFYEFMLLKYFHLFDKYIIFIALINYLSK